MIRITDAVLHLQEKNAKPKFENHSTTFLSAENQRKFIKNTHFSIQSLMFILLIDLQLYTNYFNEKEGYFIPVKRTISSHYSLF